MKLNWTILPCWVIFTVTLNLSGELDSMAYKVKSTRIKLKHSTGHVYRFNVIMIKLSTNCYRAVCIIYWRCQEKKTGGKVREIISSQEDIISSFVLICYYSYTFLLVLWFLLYKFLLSTRFVNILGRGKQLIPHYHAEKYC